MKEVKLQEIAFFGHLSHLTLGFYIRWLSEPMSYVLHCWIILTMQCIAIGNIAGVKDFFFSW